MGAIVFNIMIVITDDSPYPRGGRDTEAEFGDRRFVTLSGYDLDEEKQLCLYDREIGLPLDNDVKAYMKKGDYVYTLGENIKLNYKTGEYERFINLFSVNKEADRKIFEKLETKVQKK